MISKKFVFLVFLTILGCMKNDAREWYLDSSFSVQLVSFSEEILSDAVQDPTNAVEVVQIFRSKRFEDSLDSLSKIRSKELVYETRKQDDIRTLFRATRTGTRERCDSPAGDFTFSILAFDHDLMRVGFVRYFPCRKDGIGWIQTPGSNSVYYSSETANVMKKILPDSILRKM